MEQGHETILVVEDEPMVRDLVVSVLTWGGYRPLVAENGTQAAIISRSFAGPIELMLSEVLMPDMRGQYLAAMLAPERPSMRVLYVSGDERAGPNFLAKPYTCPELLERIRQVLDAP